MGKDSALYQLMDTLMNGVVSDDGEYRQISRKSDKYSCRLAKMELSKEVRLLIGRYVSKQNAHSTCAIDPGMGYSPTCLGIPTARRYFGEMPANTRTRPGNDRIFSCFLNHLIILIWYNPTIQCRVNSMSRGLK